MSTPAPRKATRAFGQQPLVYLIGVAQALLHVIDPIPQSMLSCPEQLSVAKESNGPGRRRSRSATEKTTQTYASLFTLVPAMIRKTILLLAVLLVQAAHADSLKDALTHKYKNQLLALRSPFTSRDQKFDSSGQSLNTTPSSGWLLYGAIYVEKVNLSSNTFRLEGHRATYYDEKRSGKRLLLTFDKSQRIEILLNQPLNSLDGADAVMARIFFLGADAVEHVKPELRRSDDDIPDDQIRHASMGAFRRPGDNAQEAVADRHQEIVLPPRPTYTPEPEFSEQARRAKYQGTVVLSIVIDKAGKVSRIRLERPLGMRLDENAMEGVKRWRFNPGTRNGEPVAVAMNIEVSFNLY